jgi:hypothetical protein
MSDTLKNTIEYEAISEMVAEEEIYVVDYYEFD